MKEHNAASSVVLAAMIVLVTLAISPTCKAQNYEQQFVLQDNESTYKLALSVTPALYEYYQQKNHQLTLNNFATFVTPYSMAPVADDIRSVFLEEEEFVNAVLMLVHQVAYQVVADGKYPVETVFEKQGDCDLLSYVAASLTLSQGFETVLFYYEHESHMNVGVSLSRPPSEARTSVTYIDYEGTRYYVAECTGGEDWQSGWRVGECPPELEDAQLTVVTLENSEQIAPGQVSSSFSNLESSAISLLVSSSLVIEGDSVRVTGQTSISNPGGTVVVYAATADDWFMVGESTLDSEGRYALSWKPTSGQFRIRASWAGDDEHAGADSEIVSVLVIPRLLVVVFGGLILVTILTVLLLLIYRMTHGNDAQSPSGFVSQQAQE